MHLDWDLKQLYDDRAHVEIAVGVLMQRHGWDAGTARTRLILAAALAKVSVLGLATALLAFYPQYN